MSFVQFKGRDNETPLSQLVAALKTDVQASGGSFADPTYANGLVSMESLNAHEVDELQRAHGDIVDTLRNAFIQVGMESFNDGMDASLAAGAVVAMAAGNPSSYARAAYNSKALGAEGRPVVEIDGAGMDFRDNVAMEAFDERELREYLPYSIVFNVQASRQDEFAETFYPTTVVTPEQAGLDVTVRRTMVYNAVRHATSGAATNFEQKNLIEAAIDYTILADESTALVPYKNVDGSADASFVAASLVPSTLRTIAKVDVPTAPLVVNKEISLLGLSAHPGLIGAGIIDHSDAIDNGMGLQNIYLQGAATDDGAGGTVPGAVLKFNVERLPRSGFVKSIEGSGRELNLNFKSSDLVINKDKTAVDGIVPTPLMDAIVAGQYTVRLKVNVNGEANVQYGNVKVYASQVEVDSIQDVDGNEVGLSGGDGAAIVAAFAGMTVIGYDLKAFRTNSNRRTRGLLLDTLDLTERYSIPLGAPISAPSPTGSNRDARDLEALISAARVRNSNMAVTRLLSYADTLKAYVGSTQRKDVVPSIEGMGRYLVKPFFEEVELDLDAKIDSIRDQDRAADVSALLVNQIRDISYRAYRDSGYQPALNATPMGGQTPVLLIGTDVVLERHLQVVGDSRTFGISFPEFKIVSTFDGRMKDKIVLAFTRKSEGAGPDPLSFGTHAWIPELASSVQVNRDGATYPEAMVQPRNLHVNHLPIMAVINVKNLDKVLTTQTNQP